MELQQVKCSPVAPGEPGLASHHMQSEGDESVVIWSFGSLMLTFSLELEPYRTSSRAVAPSPSQAHAQEVPHDHTAGWHKSSGALAFSRHGHPPSDAPSLQLPLYLANHQVEGGAGDGRRITRQCGGLVHGITRGGWVLV